MKWITIILVLISLTATGQGNRVKKEYRDSVANENVQTLKDGVLLVRLRSSQKSLQALLKRGDTIGERNKAREIRLKQLEIVNAFKVKYHFSDVYFFYSHHTSAVMEKQWDGVILNDSLVSDGFKPEKYLIVDPYRIQFDAMDSGGIPQVAEMFVSLWLVQLPCEWRVKVTLVVKS